MTFGRREIEVIELTAKGLTNKEIAKHFGTALKTVKNQQEVIKRKLGVRNRVEVVLRAATLDLIQLEPFGPLS